MARELGETHRSGRAGWLRAAVLGADDAIVSIASLMIGVAASSASKEAVLIAGVAGLVAGSMSMAVGGYVSVSSQRDAEQADVERETGELASQPHAELNELRLHSSKPDFDNAISISSSVATQPRSSAIQVIPPFSQSSLRPLTGCI
jgi:VIT1/CCC1 family predicted Fe2+/Mn2+ transporter